RGHNRCWRGGGNYHAARAYGGGAATAQRNNDRGTDRGNVRWRDFGGNFRQRQRVPQSSSPSDGESNKNRREWNDKPKVGDTARWRGWIAGGVE
ncbi:unnamed protein product, partial [Sphacelaria rigidula]